MLAAGEGKAQMQRPDKEKVVPFSLVFYNKQISEKEKKGELGREFGRYKNILMLLGTCKI